MCSPLEFWSFIIIIIITVAVTTQDARKLKRGAGCLHLSTSILLHHPLPVEWVVYVPSPEQLLLPGGCEGARRLPGFVPSHPHQVGMVGDPLLLA